MAIKRKLDTAGSESYYNAVKNRYSNPSKIDFRQGRINELRRQGVDTVIDRGNTMSEEPDADYGARKIRNRATTPASRKKVQKAKKTINEILNLRNR